MKRIHTNPTRTQKIGVCMTPESLEQLQILANIDGVNYSFKAYEIIQQYLDAHQQQIQQYKNLMSQMIKE